MKHNLRQKGHVASEWVIVTFLMIIALFAPIPGTDQSVTGLMMESIKEFHASNSFLLSLP